MSITSTPRMIRRPSRAVFSGTALGALLLVGGAGIGCAASGGHGNATPQKTVTKTAAPGQQAQPSTSGPTSNPVPGVAHPAPPASNPAPVTHGSGQGGQGAPTSNPGSSGSGTVGPVSVDGSATGGTNPADGSATGGTNPADGSATGGTYNPPTNGTGGYDPSTSGASAYTAPTDSGTTPATAPDTTPQPNMDAYHAYDQQSWDAWKASSDAANAGDPAAAYAYNQASINSTANANAAYSGTPDTSAVAPDTSPVAPSGE